jgi:hypothetical protein
MSRVAVISVVHTLVGASRGTAWDDGAVKAGLSDDIDFDGGVAARVIHLEEGKVRGNNHIDPRP